MTIPLLVAAILATTAADDGKVRVAPWLRLNSECVALDPSLKGSRFSLFVEASERDVAQVRIDQLSGNKVLKKPVDLRGEQIAKFGTAMTFFDPKDKMLGYGFMANFEKKASGKWDWQKAWLFVDTPKQTIHLDCHVVPEPVEMQ